MFILDSVRPYLVANSLYNSALTTLGALPTTLLFGWLLTTLIGRVAVKRQQQIALAVGLSSIVSFTNFWLLPSLAVHFAYIVSAPKMILLLGVIPALAWSVAPIVALIVLLNRPSPHLFPSHPVTPARFALLRILLATWLLLLCNGSVPLLLSGGRPFNATHTLPSWIFTEAWVNGENVHTMVQASLLSLVLMSSTTLVLLFERNKRTSRLGIRILLVGVAPACLIVVPYMFRLAGWVDGRMPLWLTEGLVATGIVVSHSIFKSITDPMHSDKPAWVGRISL